MTQHLANLAERSSMAQHLGSQSVAELMGTRCGRVDASALKCMPNDGAEATWSTKAGDGRACT